MAALRVVAADDDALRARALTVRTRVFVDEQGVPAELELDGRDASCAHVLATLGDEAVGAARYRRTEDGVKLERVAVLAEARGRGVGEALVSHIHARVPGERCYVHAQQSAYGFWERVGYVPEGEVFHEADIPHRRMVREPSQA